MSIDVNQRPWLGASAVRSPGGDELDGITLDERFAAARRHECALNVALLVGDDLASVVTSARLTQTLQRARAVIAAVEPALRRAALVAVFQASTQTMYRLLRVAPNHCPTRDSSRLARWMMAPGRPTAPTRVPDLFEIDAGGTPLSDHSFAGLHAARCRFISALPRARFTDVLFERSDFTYGDLRDTVWQQSCARGSCFRDGSFANAVFDGATFLECDLRRVDFSIASQAKHAAGMRVQFVGCDLRGVIWEGRDLSGVAIVDCKLDEAGGARPVKAAVRSGASWPPRAA
jgi:hypothetical protein